MHILCVSADLFMFKRTMLNCLLRFRYTRVEMLSCADIIYFLSRQVTWYFFWSKVAFFFRSVLTRVAFLFSWLPPCQPKNSPIREFALWLWASHVRGSSVRRNRVAHAAGQGGF